MRKIKTIQKFSVETEDIICNKCEKSLKVSYVLENIYSGLSTAYFADNSDKFENGKGYFFDLCDECLKALFSTFKIPPDEE